MPRKTISADITRGIRTRSAGSDAASRSPRLRARRTETAATSTTSGQPTPTSTRLAPVMLASASAHGFSPSGFGTQAPASAYSCPA